MDLHMTQEWLLRMAEKEGNGIVSVGGLVGRIEVQAQAPATPAIARQIAAQVRERPATPRDKAVAPVPAEKHPSPTP